MQQGFRSPCNMHHWWEASPLCCFGIQIQIHSISALTSEFCLQVNQGCIPTRMSDFPAPLLCCPLSPFSQLCSLTSTRHYWTEVTVTVCSKKYWKDCLIRLVIHIFVGKPRSHFAPFPFTDSHLMNKKKNIPIFHQNHKNISEKSHPYNRF